MARVVVAQRWRSNVIASTPDLYLIGAMFGGGLCLVEALKFTVVAFIESPVAHNRNPHQVHLFHDEPKRTYRTSQHGRERDIERVAFGQHRLARLPGFEDALLGQIDVRPSGEEILEVPLALAVANEDELSDIVGLSHGGAYCSQIAARRQPQR